MGSEPTNDSFLAIGVALSLIMIGELAVYFLSRLQFHFPRLPHLPHSFVFLGLGAGVASLLQFNALSSTTAVVIRDLDASFGEVVIKLLLPPVVLHSAIDLGRGAGAVDLGMLAQFTRPGLALASLGTLSSAFITGAVMYLLGQLQAFPPLSLTLSLLLGTCISASDTPAVLNLFATLQPGPEAFALTYIESMFNDAVSIVSFHTLARMVQHPEGTGALAVLKACGLFLAVFLGSLALGSVVGGMAVQLFKTCRVGRQQRLEGSSSSSSSSGLEPAPSPLEGLGAPQHFAASPGPSSAGSAAALPQAAAACTAPPASEQAVSAAAQPSPLGYLTASEQVEVTILCLTGFVAYMTAEGVGCSGVVACLSCGVLLGRYALPVVSPPSRAFTLGILKLLASLCDRMVFLGIGIALPELAALGAHWRASLCLLLAVLLARALSVWACCALVNLGAPAHRPVTTQRARLIVGWAGTVRGGVAFALASLGQGLMESSLVAGGAGVGEGEAAAAVFPVSSLFVVLATLLMVTVTLPRVIQASPPAYYSFHSADTGEDSQAEAAEAGSGSGGASGGAAAPPLKLVGGVGSRGGEGSGAPEEEDGLEASFAELLGRKKVAQQQQQQQQQHPTPRPSLAAGLGTGAPNAARAPSVASAAAAAPSMRGTFGSIVGKLKEKATAAVGSSSGSGSSGGGSRRQSLAPLNASASAGGQQPGAWAGRLSSGLASLLAPPPPSS